jgi:Zn-dependent alcohol dehydrogenase
MPAEWAERGLPKLIHCNELDKGAHSAARKQPKFVDSVSVPPHANTGRDGFMNPKQAYQMDGDGPMKTVTREPVSKLKQPQSSSAAKRQAWVAKAPRQPMTLEVVDLGPFEAEEVEIAVEHCGLCHSDLSVLNDEWGISQYPAVLGHEVIGRVTAVGPNAKRVAIGQRVGVGWHSGSCMHCRQCMSGSHHLCPQVQLTIVGHRGGFASHIRTQWAWAIPLPDELNLAESGPLLCGGVTVFAPLAMHAKPTSRVGIIGIGGLGHMAVKLAAAYG